MTIYRVWNTDSDEEATAVEADSPEEAAETWYTDNDAVIMVEGDGVITSVVFVEVKS